MEVEFFLSKGSGGDSSAESSFEIIVEGGFQQRF